MYKFFGECIPEIGAANFVQFSERVRQLFKKNPTILSNCPIYI